MVTTNFQLGSLDGPYTNSNFLDDNLTDDVYSFTLEESRGVDIDLTGITAGDDADLYLYQDDGDLVFELNQDTLLNSSLNGGNTNDSISEFSLDPGVYFVQVERYAPGSDGSLDYTIDISFGVRSSMFISLDAGIPMFIE